MGYWAHKFITCLVMFAVLAVGVNCLCAAQPRMVVGHPMGAHECASSCAACCVEQTHSDRPTKQDGAECPCDAQGLYTSTSSPAPDLKPAAVSPVLFLAVLPGDGGVVAATMPVCRGQRVWDFSLAASTTTLLRLHCALTV